MEQNEIISKIQELMCDILEEENIVINETTTANDIEGWDSLSHAILISELQKTFKIKLHLKDVLKFKNVGDMCFAIKQSLEEK